MRKLIGQTLGRHWAGITQTLGRHLADIDRNLSDIGQTLQFGRYLWSKLVNT